MYSILAGDEATNKDALKRAGCIGCNQKLALQKSNPKLFCYYIKALPIEARHLLSKQLNVSAFIVSQKKIRLIDKTMANNAKVASEINEIYTSIIPVDASTLLLSYILHLLHNQGICHKSLGVSTKSCVCRFI